MKIKLYAENPYHDFIFKSVLFLYFIPYLFHVFLLNLFFLLGSYSGAFEGEGVLLAFTVGGIIFYASLILGFFLALFIILFFNKKLMSGDRVVAYNPGKKFTRIKLFLLSLVFFIPIFWGTFFFLLFSPLSEWVFSASIFILDFFIEKKELKDYTLDTLLFFKHCQECVT